MGTKSKRFTSERTANNFAKQVNGDVQDLRAHDDAKSNFKVHYSREGAREHEQNKMTGGSHNYDKDGYVND